MSGGKDASNGNTHPSLKFSKHNNFMLLLCRKRLSPSTHYSSVRANLFDDGWALWLQALLCFGKLGALPLGFLCGSGRLVPVLAPSWHPLGSPYMSSTVVPPVLAYSGIH